MEKDRFDSMEKIKDGLYGKIKDKQNGRKKDKDCCEEFKFIRKTNTISFNNKMNRLGITHLVLDEEYNMTDVFYHDIANPIKYGAGTTFGIKGYTRSGKSRLAELIVKLAKQANKKFLNRDIDLHLVWDQPEFHKELNKLKRGDILWKDEDPKGTRKGSRTQKWEIENVLHAIAKMENTFIFIDPKKIKIDSCDLYLESAGINRKTRINRYMIMDDQKYYFGHIYIKIPDEDEEDVFWDWYEEEKDKFIKKSIKLRGKFLADEEYEEDEDEYDDEDGIINMVKKNDKDSYKAEPDLDSFEYLEDYLKSPESDNKITIKGYAELIGITYDKSRRKLRRWEIKKYLQRKNEAKGLKVYFLSSEVQLL